MKDQPFKFYGYQSYINLWTVGKVNWSKGYRQKRKQTHGFINFFRSLVGKKPIRDHMVKYDDEFMGQIWWPPEVMVTTGSATHRYKFKSNERAKSEFDRLIKALRGMK
jgi:hypothetical protein